MKAIKIVSSIVIFLIATSAWSQTEPTKKKVRGMVFTQEGSKKTNKLTEGRKLTITFKDTSRADVKGRYYIVNDSTIMIKNETYALADIRSIGSQRLGQRIAGTAVAVPGVIIASIGAIVTLVGVGYYAGSQGEQDAIVLTGVGLATTVVGAIPTIIGLKMIFGGKTFDIQEKWTVSIVS